MVLQVIVGEQDLSDRQVEGAEKLFVNGHEAGLAHCGAGLQLGQIVRAFGVTQRPHAGADSAGGHDHHFLARLALLSDLRHQLLHLGKVGLFAAVGQDAGAEFDDDAGDAFEQIGTHGRLVAKWAIKVEVLMRRRSSREGKNWFNWV